MSGPVTFSGIFSGIDTATIVERLMEIERQPLRVIQQEQLQTQRRLAIFKNLQSRLSSLDSAIQSLNRASTLGAKTATSSNTDVLTVSASSAAAAGSFTIDSITNLARAASEASIGVTDKTADFVSGSSFSFDVGTETVSISLSAGETTLEGLRDAINTQATGLASAAIIDTGDDNDPYKLVIRSVETGADSDISNISTDIVVSTTGGDVALSFVPAESVDGLDALFKVNDVEISRGSNTVSDVLEGVTLELKGTTGSPVTVTVARDTDTIKSEVNEFISAYNDINSLIQSQFDYNEETESAGPLSGDFTLRQIQGSLQSLVVGGIEDADGNRYSLATIGIEIDKYSGALSLDESKFNEAIANDDKQLFLDLFLARGVPSDKRVTYVSSRNATQAGNYEINITGYDGTGNAEGTFTLDGQVYTGIGEGQCLVGPEGTPAEGLRIRIASGVTGALGSVYFSVGVAEQFERRLDDFLMPISGLLPKVESRLKGDLASFADHIAAFEERLEERQRELTQQFIAAEQAIASLQSQSSSFSQQLNNIGGGSLL
ncbi:MAG TPA: flagellar filament capping protein FliD [Acidobacteriota bacterium]|nr:flagellar filament capping protein FliD [Acidobacteriota bacterium]